MPRPAPCSLRTSGLSCPASTDIATNSFYNSTLSGLPMAGQCLPGYSASVTPPSRVCQLTGVWSSVTGNCGRTSRQAALGGLRAMGEVGRAVGEGRGVGAAGEGRGVGAAGQG